ncbi:hypothetical protein GO730_38625 [Spirosoma sp. HMF3257]|uniref:Uncharacterized protein n=1 Tax=Spirosoma telluris TaxID=2183553 RepID=A0A327NCP7_9BACT|nr:hypothetical protein [Spirosoma telluris]RAI73020.1 hypothetical protein HMF3257_38545 [Spirosoma telluris]
MKQALVLLGFLAVACQGKHERFVRESSAFPADYIGKWQAISDMNGPKRLVAGITIQHSGDSLVWHYFSQIVDTITHHTMPCGPDMDFMPILWDDSLNLAKANHGVGQGYGFDDLRLLQGNQLQMNSFSLASYCRGPFGLNSTQLIFTKVNSFRYQP